MRLQIESPMLCFNYKNLKPEQQEALETDSNWIAEEKANGARCLIVFSPAEGFSFFSRHVETKEYLPHDFTENILLVKDGQVSRPRDWRWKFTKRFMLDSEILINGNIDTTLYNKTGVETGKELNAVCALMAINAQNAQDIQINQAQVYFKVFDILQFDGDRLWGLPLSSRRRSVEGLMHRLAPLLPFELTEWVREGKDAYFKRMIAECQEGIVYKNLNMPYLTTESRPRTHQIKRKRTATESGQSDIDTFIGGYGEATDGKAWAKEGLIGSLKLYVFLDGQEHHLATVSGMPLEIRQMLTEKDKNGRPVLKQEFYNKVVVASGQDFSAKSKRLSHALIEWARGFRTDKSYLDCTMSSEELDSQIL
jgi:ATP-dependent DNA ligase